MLFLSDLAVRRPVFAIVINFLIVIVGIVAFLALPLREYPNIDPPVVTIKTEYPGASAIVIESKITEIIEESVAGLQSMRSIQSSSEDGRSNISLYFNPARDIDSATNDVRDRVSGIVDNLPRESKRPEIEKADSSDNVIMWLNLNGEGMSLMQITDYAKRYIKDNFSTINGVARVRIGGAQDMALRIWLRQQDLISYQVTPQDILQALEKENIELPGGYIESWAKDFTVRVSREYLTVKDFQELVIRYEKNGGIIRLEDIADISVGALESRTELRGNGIPMVGIGIIKQATANTLTVARAAKEKMARLNTALPDHMKIELSYDTSIFIEQAIWQVYKTLFLAIVLVVIVVFLFLRSLRTLFVPALSIPTALLGGFIGLYFFGATINLLTLLAFVLSIGLIIDDAIVVIENIYRRCEKGEAPLLAAYLGTRQVGFAVIATTLVIIAVFLPVVFLEGDIGKLMREFSMTIVSCIAFSTVAALTIVPVMASKILCKIEPSNSKKTLLDAYKLLYLRLLTLCINHSHWVVSATLLLLLLAAYFGSHLATELAPQEDRGAFFMFIRGPQGTSYDYIAEHVKTLEDGLMPFVHSGEFKRLLFRIPGSFGNSVAFNSAIGIVVLNDWNSGRKPIWYYVNEVRNQANTLSGVFVFPAVRQAFGGRIQKPIQFVLGGATYEELVTSRDILLEKAQTLPYFRGLDSDYRENKPYINININRRRAADAGVSIKDINQTLQILLGGQTSTTFLYQGEEYDIKLESEKSSKRLPEQIHQIHVRSQRNQELVPLANLVTITEEAQPEKLFRVNRLRSITIESNLTPGVSLGEGLHALEQLAKEHLPENIRIAYKGPSEIYKNANYEMVFFFFLALAIAFLVLAAQFESFIHPFIIMLTVPLAMVGALLVLYATGQTLNIYSEVGLVILIAIAAKNGILIVEFINQLRDQGVIFQKAITQAAETRFRPIVMTALTTAMGALPLVLSSGAGSEARFVIGVVILSGVLSAMLVTLFFVPVWYQLLAKNTLSPQAVSQELADLLKSSSNDDTMDS